jgi:hypothetical protein
MPPRRGERGSGRVAAEVWRPDGASISLAAMSNGSAPKHTRFDPPLGEIRARQMGELLRGESHWDVLLETVRDGSVDAFRGRIHFVGGNTHRISGWIFLEWKEADVLARFGEFSAQELWNLLDSLA